MSDQSQTTSGQITRDAAGTIVEPGSQTTETTPSQTTPETGQITETPPAADKKDNKEPSLVNSGDKDAKPELTGAPEKYEAYTLPEGVKIDDTKIVEFNEFAKSLNLSQAGAQQAIDFHVKALQAAQEAPLQVWKDQQTAWKEEIVKDSNYGTGKDLRPEVKTRIGRMIDGLGPLAAPFREFMDYSGAGNNPAAIRAFDALAKRFTEGTAVVGNGPGSAGQTAPGAKPNSAAKALYPNLA